MEITNRQKEIYNIYLKNLAKKANRPFSYRKNFDNIKDEDKLSLYKLEALFKRNPEINVEQYFRVVFENSPNTFIKIDYFYNILAIRTYTKKISELYSNSLDSPEMTRDFLIGIKYVRDFCEANNIRMSEYGDCVNEYKVPYPLIHLKQNKINLYHFHFFNINIFTKMEEDILNMYLDNFKEKFVQTRRDYNFSSLKNKITKNK